MAGGVWYTSELEARTNSGNAVFQAGVDGVHDALHTHVEYNFGLAVEPLGAIDRGQVTQAVDAPGGFADGFGVPDVRFDEFDVIADVRQAGGPSPGLVVEYPNAVAVVKQAPYQGGNR